MPKELKVFLIICGWIVCGIINCFVFRNANGYLTGWMILLGLVTGPYGILILVLVSIFDFIGQFLTTKFFIGL